MITVSKREVGRSEFDQIQLWLTNDQSLRFRQVLASRVAELQAEFANDMVALSIKRNATDKDTAGAGSLSIPPSLQSKLSLATRYQVALDVLDEMSKAEALMAHVTLKNQYA